MGNSFNVAAMNRIKTIKESLEDRYSSSQMMNVLDQLLHNGLSALAEGSDFINSMLASCLVWYNTNTRRKISSLPKEKVLQLLTLYPVVSVEEKSRILRKLRFERNVWFYILEAFCQHGEKYADLELRMLKTKDYFEKKAIQSKLFNIQRSLNVHDSVTALFYNVRFWFQQAVKFRNQIMERYMRHSAMKAHSYYRAGSSRNDLADVIQNFQLALNKAVNKFDQRKGTLTSYINFWLRGAQSAGNTSTHEYGIAYTIPSNVRKEMAKGENAHSVNIFTPIHDNKSVEDMHSDDPTPEENAERESDIVSIRRIAKRVDPHGLLRIRLGIGEVLNEDEKKLLHAAATQLGR